MPKFFVNKDQVNGNKIIIKGNDVNHIKNVLREKIGNIIEICNLDLAKSYMCEIMNFENDNIECLIKNEVLDNKESNIKITIFQGLPKADKMELIIQKAVELGVYNIVPTEMKRCVVKLNDKDKIKKKERWQKISEVAAKQCGRDIIPEINKSTSLKMLKETFKEYDYVIVTYENEKEYSLKQEINKIKNNKEQSLKIGIVIGPEGGIAPEEIEFFKEIGAKVVTLGNRILRTETVALNVLSILMYELEN